MKAAHLFLLAVALAAAVLSPSAAAAPGLLLGVDDDSLRWYAHTQSLLSIYNDLGVGAVRVNVAWSPGETFPVGTDRTELNRVGNASRRIRVVLAVTGPASSPPLDAAGRASYCGFVANVLRVYPSIRDVAVWTEPNSKAFWQPQKGAPAAYEALLAAVLGHAPRRRARGERDRHQLAAREARAAGSPDSALPTAHPAARSRSSTRSATTPIRRPPPSRRPRPTRRGRSTRATSTACWRR